MKLVEIQIDRLVGPTHHFGGLGVGNLASQEHAGLVSDPTAAALQGLDKMRLVASLGVPQLVLPPQPRPAFRFLQAVGFSGSDAEILEQAAVETGLLSAATSCSAMWTANAATATPGIDGNGRTTVTVANLSASLHRSLEAERTQVELEKVLPTSVLLRQPIPGGAAMRDEGAANHMRLGTDQNQVGVNVFVYGDGEPKTSVHWPRQTLAACRAIARSHQLPSENVFFLKQHPHAIDAGAFHNDVVALSHAGVLIHHEYAFADHGDLKQIERRYYELTGRELKRVEVAEAEISLADAVRTYLFNSQVVMPDEGHRPVILCPSQVREHAAARRMVGEWCRRGLFREAHYMDLHQSMDGGGGPACLRLRVPLTEEELETVPSQYRWSEELDQRLRHAITEYYPSSMKLANMASSERLQQVLTAQAKIELALNW